MLTLRPETLTQTSSTPYTDAPSPFNRPSEDVVLRSSDGTDLYVNKWVLRDISSFFADMFDVPQPTVTKREDASGNVDEPTRLDRDTIVDVETSPPSSRPLPTVIPVSEDARTLGLFLKLCYPSAILAAAHKYHIDHIFDVLRPRLEEISRKTPVRVYAFAARYGSGGDECRMSALMRDAARDFLRLPDPMCYADELASIDAATYYRLIMYRNLCTSSLQELRRTPLRAWFSNPGKWTWFLCEQCGQHKKDAYDSWDPHVCDPCCIGASWLHTHWARICDVLGKTPHAEAIRNPELADSLLQEASRCDTCRKVVSKQIRRFTDLFAEDIQRRLSKISLDNVPCVAFTDEPDLKLQSSVDE
ncbi:hypothetical protein C8T65DRAFT_666594 [Cerioporus squamosus]|nr:hypothetical protein C8T65DRAFT_666594 [Cerioporus squamosus]